MTMENITLAEVIQAAMDSRIFNIHIAIPGIVEAYDPATQLADVKPLISRPAIDEDGGTFFDSLPVLPSCPVAFPRAGDFFISLPLKKGNTGLIVFCDRSLDQWLTKGGEVDPIDTRTHTPDGAVFYPGLWAQPDKLSDVHAENIVIGKTGGTQVHVKDGTIALGSENPSDNVALAKLTKSEIQGVADKLNSLINKYNLHIHPAATGPTSATVSIETVAPAVGNVASDVVEAD